MPEFFRPYEGDKPFFFVSYSHRNTDFVLETITALRQKPFLFWYDEGIPAGSDWPKNIADHMDRCSTVLFFRSQFSFGSPNCLSEIATARERGKKILCVPLDEAKPVKEREKWEAALADAEYLPPAVSPAALADALSVRQTCPEPGEDLDETERIKALMDSLIPVRASTETASEKRFLSAISCRGILHLNGTVNLLCKQKYELRDSAGLELAARLAAERGAYAIVCPEPLDPERPEAVLLPEYSACFIRAENAGGQNAKFTEAMDRALAKLAGAKALHDELESLYRPYMDFPALTEYTEEVIGRI